MDDSDALGMYWVEEHACPLVFGSLPDSEAEIFRVSVRSLSALVMTEPDGTGTSVRSDRLLLQGGVKTPTVFRRFEEYNAI